MSWAKIYYRNKFEYPKNLYCDIMGCTDFIPDESIILKNINMALDTFKKDSTLPSAETMVKVTIMYYKDKMTMKEIANNIGKSTEVVRYCITRLIYHIRYSKYFYIIKNGKPKPISDSKKNNEDADSINKLKLSTRAYNCLRHERIMTITELTNNTEEFILTINNAGPKVIDEIKEKLANIGLQLAPFDHKSLLIDIGNLDLDKDLCKYLRDINLNTAGDLIYNQKYLSSYNYDYSYKVEGALRRIGLSLKIKPYIKSNNSTKYRRDLFNKLVYELDYEDACKLLLQIRTSGEHN